MRLLYTISLLFFTYITSFAQSRPIQLQWEDKPYLISSGKPFLLPQFQSDHFNFNNSNSTISYTETYKDRQFADENSLQVTQVRYETVDLNIYKELKKDHIPTAIQPKLKSYSARGEIITQFSFNALIREGNTYKKVVSLQYQYNYSSVSTRSHTTFSLNRSNSVLASGEWFKFRIEETGVYRIDRNFLTQLGIPSNVDPRTIKIYGHGGQMLPLLNSNNQYFDLPEVAIQFIGEEDGQLNDSDHILFYGIGNKGWSLENRTHLNLYSNETYYYITYGGSNGKRISSMQQPSGNATITYSNFIDRVFHERDLTNIAKLSRKWFGESFAGGNSNSFSLTLDELEISAPALLSVNAAASASQATSFNISVNGSSVGLLQLQGRIGNSSAHEFLKQDSITISNPNTTVTLTYNNNGVPLSAGYLDYIAIDYTKKLNGHGKQFGFRIPSAQNQVGIAQFNITNAANISQVWDVSDPYNIQTINNSSSTFSFKDYLGTTKEYRAIDQTNYFNPLPAASAKVSNQNIKGTIFNEGDIDYLIITRSDFVTAANRLANFHRTQNQYNVKVVPVHLIYEEFSSGKQDISAIRNFIRYVYTNATDPNRRVRFVNLFGDASFDYLDRIENNTNVVPVFQSVGTGALYKPSGETFNFNDWSCFMTDDFYGLMDEEEGQIETQNYSGIDIAVGRIPISTNEQASLSIDKIIQYHDKSNAGRWKNNYIALSDDVDSISDISLQATLETMVTTLESEKPFINFRKIYTDAYVQEVSSGGPRYPRAKADFFEAFNNGAAMVNYLGHGGTYGLAQERLLEIQDISQFTNEGRYPLFAILTCEFTWFDDPTTVSGGEALLMRRNAGAINLLATTRKIGISNANRFTTQTSNYLFNIGNISSDNIEVAEALRMTKNLSNIGEKSIVFYLGDPALKLGIAKPKVELTQINGIDIADYSGSLRALDLVKISGEVTDQNNVLLSGFNGDLAVQIFDKDIDRKTLGNDGITQNGELVIMDFKTLGETIFRGNASVTNGKFSIEFVVPKDIKIAIGAGKASFYALREGQVLDDYTGFNRTLRVGGVNENAAEDNKSPEVQLYMNDESFISGGVTDESPLFIAHLSDENGINTASGIGHDIVAILDSDENNPYVLNEYYETEPDNFRKGFINFPFQNLENGLHTLTFKAWDVYNNLATSEIQFYVSKDESVSLDKVLNYPNPFVDYTEFWFEHNRPNETLLAQVQIMTVTGKIVKTINQTIVTDGNRSRDIQWDGRDDFGEKIGKGVYIYRLKVKSTLTGHQAEKVEKLVLL